MDADSGVSMNNIKNVVNSIQRKIMILYFNFILEQLDPLEYTLTLCFEKESVMS